METTRVQLKILPSRDALVEAAAERFVATAAAAFRARGRFLVALSGGTTPMDLYATLASDRYAGRVDWSLVHLFWGDERCVPPTDPMSNYRMAREILIDHVPLAAANVHRIRGEDDPATAAAACELEIRHVFGTPAGATMRGARFDLVLLGMGSDGHTASLFPGTPALTEHERWVMAQYVAEVSMWRVTFTPVLINAAAEIVFLVSGHEKAAVLHQTLEGPYQPTVVPVQVVAPHDGSVCWLVDAAAAVNLTDGRPITARR